MNNNEKPRHFRRDVYKIAVSQISLYLYTFPCSVIIPQKCLQAKKIVQNDRSYTNLNLIVTLLLLILFPCFLFFWYLFSCFELSPQALFKGLTLNVNFGPFSLTHTVGLIYQYCSTKYHAEPRDFHARIRRSLQRKKKYVVLVCGKWIFQNIVAILYLQWRNTFPKTLEFVKIE